MHKTELGIALCLVLTCSTASVSLGLEPFIDLEGGAVFSGYNDVRIPPDGGTEFSLSEDFSTDTWQRLRVRPDVAIDGTDNFAARMLLNDLAVRDAVPWIYGGAVGSVGRAMVVVPGQTPCLRCVFESAPPSIL